VSGDYNRKDRFYALAKAEGYRSRAAYKLRELNDKFKFLAPGSAVLDLGSWPGGWTQIASEQVGERGLVVSIDLVELDPIAAANVRIVTGDVRDDASLAAMRELLTTDRAAKFSAVISDMSPKLTGIKEADQAGSVACAELAVWVAQQLLKPGGTLVMKVFKGNETEQFYRATRGAFEKLHRVELDSTRRSSNEFYLVGQGFKSAP
jgi:23S rRNA (uridine2552-2'-O)-methyltransferase